MSDAGVGGGSESIADDQASFGADVQVGPWRRRSRRVAYENPWLTLFHDEVTRPDGSPGIYGVVHFGNVAVGVVALDEGDRIVLVGQHRYTLDLWSWEIPEGGSLLGEDPLAGARRELREETGLAAADWSVLARAHVSNSVTDEEAVLYLATGLSHGEAAPDDTEELAVRWVAFDEALSMIERGEITDALTIIALQRLALDRMRGMPRTEAHERRSGIDQGVVRIAEDFDAPPPDEHRGFDTLPPAG